MFWLVSSLSRRLVWLWNHVYFLSFTLWWLKCVPEKAQIAERYRIERRIEMFKAQWLWGCVHMPCLQQATLWITGRVCVNSQSQGPEIVSSHWTTRYEWLHGSFIAYCYQKTWPVHEWRYQKVIYYILSEVGQLLCESRGGTSISLRFNSTFWWVPELHVTQGQAFTSYATFFL